MPAHSHGHTLGLPPPTARSRSWACLSAISPGALRGTPGPSLMAALRSPLRLPPLYARLLRRAHVYSSVLLPTRPAFHGPHERGLWVLFNPQTAGPGVTPHLWQALGKYSETADGHSGTRLSQEALMASLEPAGPTRASGGQVGALCSCLRGLTGHWSIPSSTPTDGRLPSH